MKKLLTFSLALMLSTLFATNIYADEFKKNYQEKYDINPDALLKTDTRYGDVVIKNWSENAISIKVTITVNKSSQSKADDFFEKVDINLKGNSTLVSAVTEISNLKGNNEFSIDYEIYAPKTISLDLNHKYGSVELDDIEGKIDLSIKYGDFVAQKLLNPHCNFNLAYVDQLNIDELESANMNISYSEIDISKAAKLTIDSKYNEIDIDEVTVLMIDSDYDELSIGNVDEMEIEGGFSEIKIENLSRKFWMDSNYGELDINNVASGFDAIEIESNHIDIDIDVASGASYKVDLYGAYTSFSVPDGNYNINQPSFTSESIKGYIGSNSNANSVIKINGKYMDVKIK
ncbi:hypothetical protein ACFLRY_04635 [Bacteroidota bacterium]